MSSMNRLILARATRIKTAEGEVARIKVGRQIWFRPTSAELAVGAGAVAAAGLGPVVSASAVSVPGVGEASGEGFAPVVTVQVAPSGEWLLTLDGDDLILTAPQILVLSGDDLILEAA